MKNFEFTQIQEAGRLCETFTARVELMEDKAIKKNGEPYLRLLLSQYLGGPTISAIAVGDVYLFVKRMYKVGSEYTFRSGQFRTKLRESGYKTWSTSDYDLWFNN